MQFSSEDPEIQQEEAVAAAKEMIQERFRHMTGEEALKILRKIVDDTTFLDLCCGDGNAQLETFEKIIGKRHPGYNLEFG